MVMKKQDLYVPARLRETKRDRIFLNVLYVVSFLILLVEIYPLLYVVGASFSSSDAISLGKVYLWPVELNLKGYEMLAENKDILLGFKNSGFYLLVGTTINMTLTTLLAYPLSRKEMPGRNLLTLFVVLTMYIQGGLIPTFLVVNGMGMVDSLWGLILPNAIVTTNMIIMRTYFQTSIPDELREAAFLDGCSDTKFLLRVVLPLSMPILAVIGLYYAVGHWNNYFDALIYLRSSEKQSLQLVLRNILLANQINSGEGSYAESSKLGVTIKYSVIVFSCIPMMIAYPFVQRFFIKGVMIGALKG
jgi:multiple sugar transport system permease protein/putative aldouronate transport system permease protein